MTLAEFAKDVPDNVKLVTQLLIVLNALPDT